MKHFEIFLEGKRTDLIQSAVTKIESAIQDLRNVGLPRTFNRVITELERHAGNLRYAGGLVADEPETPTPM